jgi:hypothetical protein
MLVDLRIKQGCCRKSWRSRCVIWPGCCTTLVKCWGLTPHLRLNGKASSGHLRKDRVTKAVLPRPFDRMLLRRGTCFLCPDSCDWEVRESIYIEQVLSGEVLTSRFNLATTSTTRNWSIYPPGSWYWQELQNCIYWDSLNSKVWDRDPKYKFGSGNFLSINTRPKTGARDIRLWRAIYNVQHFSCTQFLYHFGRS